MYAEDVITGRIPVGRLVKLACERHIEDMANGRERGIYFDEGAANWAIEFFTKLQHSKGEWAGGSFELAPWQAFIVGSLFGWKQQDGRRRFRVAYCEVARKNGKTTLAAGIGLLLAFFDGEPGAEVYAAATKRDQAKIAWGDARAMVLASAPLKQRINVLVGNLHSETNRSKFEPLGADTDGMDGLNIHGVIIDELHAHKTRAMWDVIQTATGARRQPLTFAITTAGFDKRTICWEQHDYGVKVLEGILADDTFFPYIATIDEGDDWRDREVWAKANPNLGVSAKSDDMERKAEKAKQVPGEVNAFLRLHLDVWTTQTSRWLSDELWATGDGAVDAGALKGRPCYAALALSSTRDISALVLWFPDDAGGGDVLPFFFVPEDNVQDRSRVDMVPYDSWVDEGLITATPGNVVDYEAIRDKVNELGLVYEIREIGSKRWNTPQIQQQLMGDGFEVKQFGDGYKDMSPGSKELEKMLREGKLRHGGNAVLRWMASNVAVRMDAEEHIRPDKEASTERFDGIEALIMAIGLNLVTPEPEEAGVFFV